MRLLAVALVAALGVAAVAFAGGGPPPAGNATPAAHTVVTTGSAEVNVVMPRRRSDRTIERAVRAAHRAALPRAFKAARREAVALADAVGLALRGPVGAS
jgi:uncharacterized protein YggE